MKPCPILMYHWFTAPERTESSMSPQLEMSPALFEAQLRHLKARGFESTSLANLLSGDLPRKPVVITFDDGTLDFWQYARGALKRVGFTATLFVVTDYVGKSSTWDAHLGEPPRPLMNWDQIATLNDEGFEIGSHTHTHRTFPELSDQEVSEELSRSREVLAERLGKPPEVMAYPRGFYEPKHRELVAAAGYRGACGVLLKWGDLRKNHRYAMQRMTSKGTESMGPFKLRLALASRMRIPKERS